MREPTEGLIHIAVTKMKRHNLSPADARRSMTRWAYKPNKELITQAVKIAAKRLGKEVGDDF